MNQKGFTAQIILIIVGIIILLVLGYTFLAKPYKVYGENIAFPPYKIGQLSFSEKVTYLFRKPAVGDRVIFSPLGQYSSYIGIITKEENQNGVIIYTICSTGKGFPWTVSIEKISGKIYYPVLDQDDAKRIAESFNSSPTTPTPTPIEMPISFEETKKWPTYTNTKYGFSIKYPENMQFKDITEEPTISGMDYKTGENSYVPLKEYFKYAKRELIVTFAEQSKLDDKMTPIVPKKITDFWISGISLHVQKGDQQIIEEYKDKKLAEKAGEQPPSPGRKLEITNIIINGISVTKFSEIKHFYTDDLVGASEAIWQKDGFVYLLSNDYDMGYGNKYFDAMLSTFKFNERTP
ncbi:MAG: hypothetical protein PHQ59_01330 [Candidatus Daviesbacteria bacterium]|nr:hypothetical protein [Candidatus Daviesbacteria bacterium]